MERDRMVNEERPDRAVGRFIFRVIQGDPQHGPRDFEFQFRHKMRNMSKAWLEHLPTEPGSYIGEITVRLYRDPEVP